MDPPEYQRDYLPNYLEIIELNTVPVPDVVVPTSTKVTNYTFKFFIFYIFSLILTIFLWVIFYKYNNKVPSFKLFYIFLILCSLGHSIFIIFELLPFFFCKSSIKWGDT
jgi:hypothetical protein